MEFRVIGAWMRLENGGIRARERHRQARTVCHERKIEVFQKICILSWRVFWMAMLNRSAPTALPTIALTETGVAVLDRLANDKPQARRKALSRRYR
jgi:hypothetical protein